MNEEKHMEQTSVKTKDVSGSVIVSGGNNVTNVTNITNITQLPPKEEQQNKAETVPNNPLKSVSKKCDRKNQVHDFMDYFEKNRKTGRPQLYFIHGDSEEKHNSFIERLRSFELRQFGYIPNEMPGWPERRGLEIRKRDLIYNLANKFDCKISRDFSATDLSLLPCFSKRKLVIIRHNIYAFKWDKRHETALITWYRDYWSKLEITEKTPLFLIFLNIKYQKDTLKQKMCFWSYCSPKNIEIQLAQIAKIQNQNCPCSLIPKLEPIDKSHLSDWLEQHANMLEDKWKTIISEFFLAQPIVSMGEVEPSLSKIWEEQDKLKREMNWYGNKI